MTDHKIVSQEEWIAARKDLLREEKELTRRKDALSKKRRELPWTRVEKPYVFHGPDGKETLPDLFRGRSQLIVYHFMFGPGWKEGCVGCSFLVDHVQGALQHLEQHEVKFVAVSRAPLVELEAFKKRMGWRFDWVSSFGTDFNYDFRVSFPQEDIAKGKVYYNYAMKDFQGEEISGESVFYKDDDGNVFHTYSSYARAGEGVLSTYALLDDTPKGRNENGPQHSMGDWVRHHDRYNARGFVAPTGRFVAAECCAEEARQ